MNLLNRRSRPRREPPKPIGRDPSQIVIRHQVLTPAAVYARVSTAEDRELQNPESQLIKIRQYAEFKELKIVKEYVEYASGADDNRPILQQMLDDAKRGHFKTILVFKIDRLSRSTYKLFNIMQDMKEEKVNVVSVTEGLDTNSRLSEGIFLMLGIVAGWEREGIVERVNAGMARAKRYGTKSGRPIGRPPTYSPIQWERAKKILRERPDISLSALSREVKMDRHTLRRKIRAELGELPAETSKGA